MPRIHDSIAASGWTLVPNLSEQDFYRLAGELGTIIHQADVTVRPESKSLVMSARPLEIHTDHHKADAVGLYCVRQTDCGGMTYLVDGRAALHRLNRPDWAALRTVMLHEHKVFEDDPSQWPLLFGDENEPQIYFSYWLVRKDLTEPQASALDRFRAELDRAEKLVFTLRPSEALFFNNAWMLHGRTKIEGHQDRLLRRVWISA